MINLCFSCLLQKRLLSQYIYISTYDVLNLFSQQSLLRPPEHLGCSCPAVSSLLGAV